MMVSDAAAKALLDAELVLILVLMDDGLWYVLLVCLAVTSGLNPCFNGCSPRSIEGMVSDKYGEKLYVETKVS